MCGDLNRQGQLCGSCREGYGLPAYFSSLKCVNCSKPGSTRNMGEYLAITFVPLTILYFIMIAFKISVTSGLHFSVSGSDHAYIAQPNTM